MEVHRQTCQQCGSRDMRNLLVREAGKRQVILVRCLGCGELVARYELAGYYHHGKGLEAYLRTTAVATESTIDLRDNFEQVRSEAPEELKRANEVLAKTGREP